MFNEVTDKTHLVGFAENPFHEENRSKPKVKGYSFAHMESTKDERVKESVSYMNYNPDDTLLTTSRRSPSFRFGDKTIDMINFAERRRASVKKENYEKLTMKRYNIK